MATIILKPQKSAIEPFIRRASIPEVPRRTLLEGRLTRVEVRQRDRKVVIHLAVDQAVEEAVLAMVERELSAGLQGFEARLEIRVETPASPEERIAAIWGRVTALLAEGTPGINGWLTEASWTLEAPGRLALTVPNDVAREVLTKKGVERLLAAQLESDVGWSGHVVIRVTPAPEDHASGETMHQDDQRVFDEWCKRQGEGSSQSGKHRGKVNVSKPKARVLKGRDFAASPRPLKEIKEEENRVVIEGEVFSVDRRETKTGKEIVSFGITDYSDSLAAKFFRDKTDPSFQEIVPGSWLKLRGNVQYDKFSNELTLSPEDIVLGDKHLRTDDYPEKRVELHLHTKMSAMDACLDTGEAVARAAAWGHKAIAVTDHGVAQSFPEALAAGKKHGIKVIYGLEAYLVDDGTSIIERAPAGLFLRDAEFVVMDLETTGFSPIGDDIIQIAAVRVRGGVPGESFQTFVRPSKPIPSEVQDLTKITEDMVAGAPHPGEALRQFFDFCGDSVLVAHNAAFDYPFLRYHREKHLGEPCRLPMLDTLILARSLLPRLRSHALPAVCKEFGIKLLNHHQAVDDVKMLIDVLNKLLVLALEHTPDLVYVNDLNRLVSSLNVGQLRPEHCLILVQRQTGIKNLYKLISKSHLQYFNRTPRIPRSELMAHREGLLIGSACSEGALFGALLRGSPDDELEEIAAFFDFLEIQPAANYRGLIASGQLRSLEQLQDLNRRILELGRKLGKPVVATGDVHFWEPYEEIYRRVLKNGIGFRDEHDAPLYMRTTAEMLAEFTYIGDDEARRVVIDEPNALADSIEAVKPVPDGLFAPKLELAEERTREMSYERARRYYGDPLPELVEQRLKKELTSIIGNNFAVIYYIAHLLVKKSNEDGYLVGSRGSVGSSFVAWCMGITEVNALPPHYVCTQCHHLEWFADGRVGSGFDLPDKTCPVCGAELHKDGQDIPFETFLGFKGDKTPDIDLNFSGVWQPVIHRYTEQLLGGEKYVFRAGTIGTIADKTAYGMVKGWAEETGQTLRAAEVDRLARGFTGVKRTTGQHPGGMVVVPIGMEVEEVTPVQHPAGVSTSGIRTTHFDYHSFESNLLKLDILGHDDPTSLRMLHELTGVQILSIPMNDPRALRLFSPGGSEAIGLNPGDVEFDLGTIAVPEFGTRFVRQMLIETQPKTFSDLVRISGLSHGTDVWTNNAQELIKKGTCNLQNVIPTRDDIMVYLIYAGLEPSLAFKIMESVRKGKGLTPDMEEAMKQKNVPDWYIWSCKQIKYMFPKAHAVAYVISSLRIAWFKVYFPLEYYATYFSVRAGSFDADLCCKGPDAVRRYIEEINRKGREATAKEKDALTEMELVMEFFKRGYHFERVDLWKSDPTRFQVIKEEHALRCPFNALAGLGESAARNIAEARAEAPFQSAEDLRSRAKLTKTVIELLQNHGCLRGLPENNQLVFEI